MNVLRGRANTIDARGPPLTPQPNSIQNPHLVDENSPPNTQQNPYLVDENGRIVRSLRSLPNASGPKRSPPKRSPSGRGLLIYGGPLSTILPTLHPKYRARPTAACEAANARPYRLSLAARASRTGNPGWHAPLPLPRFRRRPGFRAPRENPLTYDALYMTEAHLSFFGRERNSYFFIALLKCSGKHIGDATYLYGSFLSDRYFHAPPLPPCPMADLRLMPKPRLGIARKLFSDTPRSRVLAILNLKARLPTGRFRMHVFALAFMPQIIERSMAKIFRNREKIRAADKLRRAEYARQPLSLSAKYNGTGRTSLHMEQKPSTKSKAAPTWSRLRSATRGARLKDARLPDPACLT
ncbi:hypothetical protein B0H13DRAFT_1923002 [Mycena leptocephala]|nr:hypothetical protein B0H13DRAFT_1923002 [Mycena leptocephala]